MTASLTCIPSAISASERSAHFELAAQLLRPARRAPIEGGYALEFAAARLTEVAKFIDNERLCCPFLSFAIFVRGSELRLELTGPDGAQEVLRAELGLGGDCGCG